MSLDVFHTAGDYMLIANRVAHVARLQEVVVGGYGILLYPPRLVEDALQFMTTLDNHRSILGRDGEPIEVDRWHMSAVALHGHCVALLMEAINKSLVNLQGGLATSENNEGQGAGGKGGGSDSLNDFISCHLLIGGEVCVTERTAQVAPTEPHEDGGSAGVEALTLEGIEDFVDSVFFHCYSS